MKITTAESSGFCFGVKNAVSTAQKVLENYDGKRKLWMF